MMKGERGFTIVEVIIAIMVLVVGLLGLVTASAVVTRMVGRGQRSAVAAVFAAQRLERLRTAGCASRTSGSDVLRRGSTPLDSASWRWVDAGSQNYRVVLRHKYVTGKNRWRTDSLETQVSCVF